MNPLGYKGLKKKELDADFLLNGRKSDLDAAVQGRRDLDDGGELLAGVVRVLDSGNGRLAGLGEFGELGLAEAMGFAGFAEEVANHALLALFLDHRFPAGLLAPKLVHDL